MSDEQVRQEIIHHNIDMDAQPDSPAARRIALKLACLGVTPEISTQLVASASGTETQDPQAQQPAAMTPQFASPRKLSRFQQTCGSDDVSEMDASALRLALGRTPGGDCDTEGKSVQQLRAELRLRRSVTGDDVMMMSMAELLEESGASSGEEPEGEQEERMVELRRMVMAKRGLMVRMDECRDSPKLDSRHDIPGANLGVASFVTEAQLRADRQRHQWSEGVLGEMSKEREAVPPGTVTTNWLNQKVHRHGAVKPRWSDPRMQEAAVLADRVDAQLVKSRAETYESFGRGYPN
eukprot:TRINITY_DN17080_c0_g1_i1.p1 TRINITY_DN17080_c0_g1~~TRINITY_DN17080_c0_g1_i1.p1  ORF type:complete len:294 (-),score=61.16 TRINITY_DN17080_c0_g1_i1:164-1045(-)